MKRSIRFNETGRCAGGRNHQPVGECRRAVGFLNPAIYGQVRSHAGTFDDVLPVHTFNDDTSLRVTPGWDDVTGLGSPNQGFLLSLVEVSTKTDRRGRSDRVDPPRRQIPASSW